MSSKSSRHLDAERKVLKKLGKKGAQRRWLVMTAKSRFTFKAHNQIPGAGYYQADCPLNECKHKEFDEDGKRSATRCRRRLSFSDAHEEELVLRRLKLWCLVAKDCQKQDQAPGTQY